MPSSFVDDPLVAGSNRLPQAPHEHSNDTDPESAPVVPWNLKRGTVPSPGSTDSWRGVRYDPEQQLLVRDGLPLASQASGGLIASDPTANTTSSTDGEDPPSSEDWIND